MSFFLALSKNMEKLGFKLLFSHMLISLFGAVFLVVSLLLHESLSKTVFQLVLESGPRVEFLNSITTRLKTSQVLLHEWILFGKDSPSQRKQVWDNDIWPALKELKTQSVSKWTIKNKENKLQQLKGYLSDISVCEWTIEDVVNTRGDTPALELFFSQAAPQGEVIDELIDSMIFLVQRDEVVIAGSLTAALKFNELRKVLKHSLTNLEMLGYKKDASRIFVIEESVIELNKVLAEIEMNSLFFSAEMKEIFDWIKLEFNAYSILVSEFKDVPISISHEILVNQHEPINGLIDDLLSDITIELKKQLDNDTSAALILSSYVIWGSRALVLFMLLLAFVLARRGAKSITDPIARLNYAALEFTRENLSKDIVEEGSIELKSLSHTFNLMREALQENIGRLKSVLETAAEAIISIDENGFVESYNQAAEKIFGWSHHEVVGQNITKIMPREFQLSHDLFVKRYLSTRETKIIGKGREVQGLNKKGEVFPIHLSVSHVEVNDRHSFTGIIVDLSDQKKIQQDLSLAKDKAELASRAKASFVANMSHEIRTPMNTIIGFAEVVLLDKSISKDTYSQVSTILNSSKALLVIINDILDVSKMNSGKLSLEKVCFNLPNMMENTIQTVEQQAKEKSLQIKVELENNLPDRFFGDPARLRQVVLNLVGNAIKFSTDGYISVYVRFDQIEQMLYFSVTDTGIGMTDEQRSKIFDTFSQADDSTSRRYGGTGLGTTISKQIVEMMGGKIWVESVIGEGSTFYFTIKIDVAKNPDVNTCLFETNEIVLEEFISPRLFNILLVEDVVENAELTKLRLRQQGHSVYWVRNGREAVDENTANNYDLILMDVQMPVLDGISATKEIRENEKNISKHQTILALTASILKSDNDECFLAGMDYIATKPIDFNALFSLMENTVPEGRGKLNSNLQSKIMKTSSNVDLSVLSDFVDVNKILDSWTKLDVYYGALKNFCKDRTNAAKEIESILSRGSDDDSAATELLHKVKGGAVSLFLTQVSNHSIKTESVLNNGDIENTKKTLVELNNAIKEVVSAVNKLELSVIN